MSDRRPTLAQYEQLRAYEDSRPHRFLATPAKALTRHGWLQVAAPGYRRLDTSFRITAAGHAALEAYRERYEPRSRRIDLDGGHMDIDLPDNACAETMVAVVGEAAVLLIGER